MKKNIQFSLFSLAFLPIMALAQTTTLTTPTHVSPANASLFSVSSIVLDWNDVTTTGTSSMWYSFELATTTATTSSGSFSSPKSTSTVSTSSTTGTTLADGLYYWHVRAFDASSTAISAWSAPWSFSLDTTAPTAPHTLRLIASTSPVIIGTTTITAGTQTWSFNPSIDALSGIARYEYITSSTSTWTSTALQTTFITNLTVGNHVVAIRAIDMAGNISATSSATLSVTTTTTQATSTPPYTPPTKTQMCKKNGWRIFTNPIFKNQGACVSFVEKMLRDKKKEEQRLKQEIKKQEEDTRKAARLQMIKKDLLFSTSKKEDQSHPSNTVRNNEKNKKDSSNDNKENKGKK
ncbi:MAG: hypothetical protein RLZZ308_334 [Candidatus Parcubacteria bacterium]|jgi:hypothetical protein